ncbi:TetR/AcrR family transcriptional regulator [Algicella marina]|uniref:TetR family transcriptional regulator n=1 Tax=Algicella marina TaxID=2683284 RepID=A0A6P1SYI3_9RHOB|nr:TetR/AcrR family transcriptional regulator [Algicella marina]QHQ35744.1 TetR family transcriptional regulator [Algicella marina]
MSRNRRYDREEALDAAMELFWRRGYHATSLKDLEEALNMRPGSIYAAFESKEALFLAALERYAQSMGEEFARELAAAASPLVLLQDHVRKVAPREGGADRPRACMLVKTLLEATADDESLAVSAGRHLDAVEAQYTRAFSAAAAAGELPKDADTRRLARRLQANMFGLKTFCHRSEDKAAVRDLAEDIAAEIAALANTG